jgi:hypothetical protein
MGDDTAGPSLLLAKQDLAHREHVHLHLHNNFHKRQATAEATAVVTEIVATVSVLQQVDVDSNGNTFATETFQTDGPSPAITDDSAPIAAATTAPASPATVTLSSAVAILGWLHSHYFQIKAPL